MSGVRGIAEVIKETARSVTESMMTDDVVILVLESVEPLIFRKSINLDFDAGNIVLPRGVFFLESDIGKEYVFIQANGGQRCYLLYERGR